MKKPFNRYAGQTYASREAELEAHAQKIDDLLRTPKTPGMHFTPNSEMRRNGSEHAHSVLSQKRVDITEELKKIREDMTKRNVHAQEQTKTQAKAL